MSSVKDIPVVDLRTATAEDFAGAMCRSSCTFVTGHGVPLELRRSVFETGRQFFHQPEEVKEAVRWSGRGIWCGWQPPSAPDIVGDRAPDPVDRYEIYDLANFTLWPEQPADMRPAWETYYRQCTALTSRLMNLLIDGMELPEELRPAWTEEQFSSLLGNYYYEQPEAPLPGQDRLHGHSDHGGLTILAADEGPGGLEIRLPGSSEWIPAVIPEDAFIVQAGDLLSRWTNRLIRGNVHRVVNPPRELAMTTRMSVVFFHHPSLDTLVEPAAGCVAASGTAPLPPLHAGEHCMKRQAAYALVPSARRGDLDSLDGREI